ncbi:hypothetical protein [Amycolatopsis sp. NPDC059021]|uniref:hypothetical protein n=1 Tax=Amycolatopsis sp. NPDC059021 TaxID=3346704 RepID=UPI003671AC3E
MSPGGEWIVEIRDDNVNSHSSVAFVVHRLLGVSPELGFELAADVQRSGAVELTPRPGPDAERLVADLQVFGLHATLRRA